MNATTLIRFFPFLQWFPLSVSGLRADFVAGTTVALVLIPQSMAYAQLAGLPTHYGLYASFLPVIIGALFGSSKQLATGPVAVVSLLTASTLTPLAPSGSEAYIALAIMLSLLVGIIQIVLGVFRLGVVINFLSHPVIIGFTNAAALIIGLSQLSKIFGLPMGRSEHFLWDVWIMLQQIKQLHPLTLLFGISAFTIMMLLRKYRPKWPNVLIAVFLTTVCSWYFQFKGMGGAIVGTIPEGLPNLRLPTVSLEMLSALLSNALVIALVGFMEAISIAKAMAAHAKERLDANQELIGQGLANVLGSLSQAYPVSGSFSRSAVNFSAGAQSGISSVFTSILVLLTLLFLTPLLYHLPQSVLAAVIMMAVVGLINFKAIHHAWLAHRHDGIAAVVSFCATLAFAPHLDKGILVGAGLAILFYLYRVMRPRVAILGRHGDGTLRDTKIHPNLPTDERIIVIRLDGQLFFANVSYFEDSFLSALAAKPQARYVLVVGDGINSLDATGEEFLAHLYSRLQGNGIVLIFSGLKRQVLDVMRNTGLFSKVGGDEAIFATEDAALTTIYQRLGLDSSDQPLLPAPLPINHSLGSAV
ncbi:SulP family inorganic anion transporter [Candidatus Magnetaquicoccus inordinatus]|uniref:SulP family inorganic anion transporter n=1 Tax=Candidatus Magnetaquicoccus inordinatus TaxID=2496818 RepID=UPI00102CD874|nr:sulfate permease [Candidatus Magnetaquicoccus inordinatus]